MNEARRKPLAASPRPASAHPREVVAEAPASGPRYPRAADLAPGDLAAAVREFAKIAACAGFVVAATTLAGCEAPQCSSSRLDELASHGGGAASLLFDLHPIDAAKELGTGMGLVPHPASAVIAGEMPAVMPAIPPPGATTPKP